MVVATPWNRGGRDLDLARASVSRLARCRHPPPFLREGSHGAKSAVKMLPSMSHNAYRDWWSGAGDGAGAITGAGVVAGAGASAITGAVAGAVTSAGAMTGAAAGAMTGAGVVAGGDGA